jgi:hypothetical protein
MNHGELNALANKEIQFGLDDVMLGIDELFALITENRLRISGEVVYL